MRTACVVVIFVHVLTFECGLTLAQPALTVPGCEPVTEVRTAIEQQLSPKVLDKLKFADKMARRRQVLGNLIADYPREVEPHRQLIQATRWWDPDKLPDLLERYRKQAALHPDDPLALYLAGVALMGKDTTERIRMLEQAKAKNAQFPWPSLELAFFYSGGKRADPK